MDAIIQGLLSTDDPDVMYRDLATIGHGATADIYKATSISDGTFVAIKRFKMSGNKLQEDDWRDMEKEINFVKKCSHEHILSYFGSYYKAETIWMVLEYCAGSCHDIIEVFKQPLLEDEIRSICYQTLLGLQYLHEQKKVHRDIKSANILLTDSAMVKLSDFGASADLSRGEGSASTFIGSPYWMAPEVIMAMETGRYSYPVDIWSLGITLIEMAETKPPLFSMHAMSALYHIPQRDPPTLQAPTWTADFVNFLSHCLLHEPEKRFTVAQLLDHAFVKNMAARGPGILRSLVQRSKDAVKKIDLDTLEKQLQATPIRQLSVQETPAEAAASGRVAVAVAATAGEGAEPDAEAEADGGAGDAQGLISMPSTPAPALQPGQMMGRLDTMKLTAQVAREQLENHGQGESAALRQQMNELRKMRQKQDEALRVLSRKHLSDFDAFQRRQQDQLDGLVRVHELEENSALRQRRQELDRLQRTQASERGVLEEELRKISNKRVRDFRALLKTRLADHKKELKRVSKEKGEETPEVKRTRAKYLENLEAQLNATFEAEEMSRYTRETESLRARQELTEEKLKYEHLEQELSVKEAHLIARINLIAENKTIAVQAVQREQVLALHSLHLEAQRARHHLELEQFSYRHERQRQDLQNRQLKANKKFTQRMKHVTLEDQIVLERFRRSTSTPTAPVSTMTRRERENHKRELKDAKSGYVQEETVKMSRQHTRELEELERQQEDERNHLLLYLQRQRESLQRTLKAELDAQDGRFRTESDAAEKYKLMEMKNFRQAKENTLAQRRAQLQGMETERATRILTHVIVPREIGDVCVMPAVVS